jgi:prophage antirepressor-like protein
LKFNSKVKLFSEYASERSRQLLTIEQIVMNSSSIGFFRFQDYKIQCFGTLENPLWMAKDVCKALGIRNVSSAVASLEDYEKGSIAINDRTRKGGNPNVLVVNESGLYSLVFKSQKPEAKEFKKWVTTEVLPSIRKQVYQNEIQRAMQAIGMEDEPPALRASDPELPAIEPDSILSFDGEGSLDGNDLFRAKRITAILEDTLRKSGLAGIDQLLNGGITCSLSNGEDSFQRGKLKLHLNLEFIPTKE